MYLTAEEICRLECMSLPYFYSFITKNNISEIEINGTIKEKQPEVIHYNNQVQFNYEIIRKIIRPDEQQHEFSPDWFHKFSHLVDEWVADGKCKLHDGTMVNLTECLVTFSNGKEYRYRRTKIVDLVISTFCNSNLKYYHHTLPELR